VLGVYKLLPGKKCRECGEPTCMVFAVKVVQEKAKIIQCKLLFSDNYRKKKEKLMETLAEAGYNI